MKLRVISIDSGGLRGVLPALILAYLEKRIQELSKKPNAYLVDCIDFVSGSAAGSVTTAAMILPNEKNRPLYHMNNIVDFYIQLGPNLFEVPRKNRWKTLNGLLGPLVPEENAEKVYLRIFDHYKMNQLIKSCAFPAYDIDKREVVVYTVNDPKHKYGNFFVKDIIRGTTAIPGLFRPGYFRNGTDVHTIIDSGLIATNPSLIAFTEVMKKAVHPKDIIFISLGTGRCKRTNSFKFSHTKHWGNLKWFNPILNIIKSANCDIVTYQMEKIFQSHNQRNYFRLNPDINYASQNSFDTSKENIQNLIKDAEAYIEENKDLLDKIAQILYDCQ